VSEVFDEKELLERVDNEWEFLSETVQMLMNDGPALMGEIRRAANAGDAPALGRAGHTLKGMVSNFCSPATHAAALRVEQIGKGADLSAAPDAVNALDAQLQILIAALTRFLAERSSCES
jgi:HPt (histidine-containing phosphotransfer) domain-containing protein